jgi:hypothetical protein
MLLERRDPESGLAISGYPRLTYRQKRALLDDLAYWMIKNEWTEVSLNSARDRLDHKIETLRADARDGTPITGQNVLALFIERSGMLRRPVEGKLDFAHRTFEEFMAANAAVGEGDIGVLVSNATNPLWREVIVLGAGLARRGERTDLIKSLLSKGDRDQTKRYQLHLLAAACLDTAVDLDSDVTHEVERRIEKLVPPSTVWEATLLADAAGEIAVPFLRRNDHMGARQAAACVRALALIGSLEAVQMIAEYADDHSFAVLKEVVRSADRVDPGLFLQLVAPRIDARRLPGDAVAYAIRKFGIQGMKNLELAESLSLTGRRAADRSILQCLPNLRTLDISGPAVTDLNSLRNLMTLRSLTLSGIGTNDFSPLQRLIYLERLVIRYVPLDLSQLAGMATLQSLSVWDAKISNEVALQTLTSLRDLMLLGCEVNDLAPLRTLENLESLTLIRCQSGDLSALGGLAGVRSLQIVFTRVGDLAWLNDLRNLQSLELYDVEISDVSAFPFLPSLQKLDLRRNDISSDQMKALRRMYPGVRIIS